MKMLFGMRRSVRGTNPKISDVTIVTARYAERFCGRVTYPEADPARQ
jgi:hypothetical protein